MSALCLLEPWMVIPDAELLSLDVTTGNLRIRVAGAEHVYLATSFRLNEVRVPWQHVSIAGMPGGVISIARASPDFGPIPEPAEDPAVEGESSERSS